MGGRLATVPGGAVCTSKVPAFPGPGGALMALPVVAPPGAAAVVCGIGVAGVVMVSPVRGAACGLACSTVRPALPTEPAPEWTRWSPTPVTGAPRPAPGMTGGAMLVALAPTPSMLTAVLSTVVFGYGFGPVTSVPFVDTSVLEPPLGVGAGLGIGPGLAPAPGPLTGTLLTPRMEKRPPMTPAMTVLIAMLAVYSAGTPMMLETTAVVPNSMATCSEPQTSMPMATSMTAVTILPRTWLMAESRPASRRPRAASMGPRTAPRPMVRMPRMASTISMIVRAFSLSICS
ncbi:hypothetical protein [Micromonospora sp. LH3U1]|uniref:hypothetical protein n=1 Tax=Micromonospora sp. LH3U1 TaxID=3018339 RepID=UPI00234BB88D|nr:hypothetical protein [Micromonospora sp. LH3U1]WCN83223.1 hypothetical protein PCA76_09315 [Micromonospora sp. LH3U1]